MPAAYLGLPFPLPFDGAMMVNCGFNLMKVECCPPRPPSRQRKRRAAAPVRRMTSKKLEIWVQLNLHQLYTSFRYT